MISINLYQAGGACNVDVDFPEKWDELDKKDIENLSRHLLANYDSAATQKAAIFLDVFKNHLEKSAVKKVNTQLIDTEDLTINGLPLIDFLFNENMRSIQPYPTLSLPGVLKKMIGPDSAFDNLICGEYEDADIHFLQFKENPDGIHLARLASVLYRPANTPYITFNGTTGEYKVYDSEKMVKHFMKLPVWKLYTIFIWYGGCRTLMTKIFWNVYEGGTGSADKIDVMAFTKCIHAAAGTKNGTRENVRKTLLKAILYDMDLEIIKAKELATP